MASESPDSTGEGETSSYDVGAESTSVIRVTGSMKWFDSTRGFGFAVTEIGDVAMFCIESGERFRQLAANGGSFWSKEGKAFANGIREGEQIKLFAEFAMITLLCFFHLMQMET